MSETETVPDEFRCNRSDGKQWRCKRRALEGKKMCEAHHSSQSLKRSKQKASESMKLVRSRRGGGGGGGDEAACSEIEPSEHRIRAKRLGKSKRKRVMGEAEAMDEAVKKMKLKRGDLQLDLIRMVLKREVEKRKRLPNQKKKTKKVNSSNGGFGEFVGEELTRVLPNGVMAISPPSPTTSNVSSPCDVKVGEEPISVAKRRFRSKNIEPLPVGKMQVVPFKGDLVNGKKEKKKRCHWCGTRGFGDLISCLSCEREFFCIDCIEKRNKGSREEVEEKCPVCCGSCRCKVCSVTMSGVTECKDSQSVRSDIDRVLHLHYAVCMLLPVLKEINAEHKVEMENDAEKKGGNPAEPQVHSSESTSDDLQLCSDNSAVVDLKKRCTRSSSVLRLSCDQDQSQGSLSRKVGPVKCSNGIKSLSDCKLKEVKGCSNNLSLSLLSLELTSKLEISAEEVVSCYELPEVLDKFFGCPFCHGMETKSSSSDSNLKEASKRREDGTGKFLYYPTVMEFQQNNLEHFQTHWSKGHPVVVRSVLKGGLSQNWDPVAMFCCYLMTINSKTGNSTDCMDWFEVEIGVKQFFLGSLRGKAETNTCQERLKLEGWLSSSLFKEQFPNHYAEILNILPISHYMDPKSGLLNIAANLPDTVQTPDFGPCLNISYRSGEEYALPDSVKKLGFETCDMVDILLYVTETHVSTKQICRIRKLMKNIGRVRSKNPEQGRESRFDKGKKRDRSEAYAQRDGLDGYPSSDSESSQHCLGAKCRGTKFEGEERESCNDSCEEESLSNSYGARWDVFQKQDVSKLLEYINNHSLELESMDSSKKNVSHPLLEQSYYLDEYHKEKLKEEFDVEPWSFDQCVGEAVIVPAGCPYQNRKNKSCVNAVVKFLSPEHVTESIKRVEELNQLPQSVKTKANKIEVKKMAIHKISEAVKEIRELTSSDSTGASRLYN
ncbi:PREDICTED: uncharacterized protein LOC104722919 isoform X2 [Camelina sativa]|uniref:Uncharacterized protein LOC104722919 isoform X2 n=1 Tax=Camelina sativa TaxID=90675 RepID=A0ABM1QJM4_CAMSA|nr:PREDICTED: uncharacterized protein LOC104722919 isoform X2 [Camelina sativa]